MYWAPSTIHLNVAGVPPLEAFVKFTLAGTTTVRSFGAATDVVPPSWIMSKPATGAWSGIRGMTLNWFIFWPNPALLLTCRKTQ